MTAGSFRPNRWENDFLAKEIILKHALSVEFRNHTLKVYCTILFICIVYGMYVLSLYAICNVLYISV